MDKNPVSYPFAPCSFKDDVSLSSRSSPSTMKKQKRLRTDEGSSGVLDKESSSFKQFDIVADYSDHHFAANPVQQPTNAWMRKIQQDWKILEKDLPEMISVRVYEERMDLVRAVIIGSAGTPYQDGLFFFDFQFTANYPNEPPKAYYHSRGLRLNPNLYANGLVCLSLLNTWHGKGCEKWDPQKSTMLQLLVSIQGLVLNAKPYFNEPGFSIVSSTNWGKKKSFAYNESTFLLSCKTMLFSLQKPPKHFGDFVTEHFRKHGNEIMMTCRAYLNGRQVGFVDREAIKVAKGCSDNFKVELKKLSDILLTEFTAKGVDCSKCLAQSDQESDCKNAEAADSKELNTQKSEDPRTSNSKLKRFGQYLLKLGKKVLPIEN